MARVKRTRDQDHRLSITTDDGSELFLVRGGRQRCYLWVGKDLMKPITISGEGVLRKLANDILAELENK